MKLRVLHGKLKHQDGASAGPEVEVHGKRFVIGSGSDCHMRCPSSTISERHCEIIQEKQDGARHYRICDLNSATGTFVNGVAIQMERPLAHGDMLRIGRLEFEVILQPAAAESAQGKRPADPVGETISEMLEAADREDRAQRLEDPAKRRFAVQAVEPPAASKTSEEPQKKKPIIPTKKPPMKLPPPPKMVRESTVDAAEEVLKKFFERPKK